MIDWNLISHLEGGRILRGYVPAGSTNSGVTIGTGIDLGYYSATDAAKLPEPLPEMLKQYLGLIGEAARAELAQWPLKVTDEQAVAIETPKRAELTLALSVHYLRDASYPFEKLPDAAQTVMMSLVWQYGAPWSRTPHFWRACCVRDWKQVISELRHFGDDYKMRRNQEADYLQNGLK